VARVRVAIDLPPPPQVVWDDIRVLSSHVDWMADAESIEFTTDQREGVGTTFDCVTRIGPVRLVDRMLITEWSPLEAMGVRHVGLVTGDGRFVLHGGGDGTRFTWDERLSVPWWLGGPLAGPVLRLVWLRNLRRLRARFEGRAPS
jgi:hypothetical protein